MELVGFGGGAITHVSGIDACGARLAEAGEGMNAGLTLSPSAAGTVERGQVLATPGSIGAYAEFTATIALLPEEHGGSEVSTGTSLAFYLRGAALSGTVALTHDHSLHPCHQGAVTVTLERPVALECGQRFAFRYRGRAAGSGTVARLLR
ncbi:hypothetical protein ACFWVC_17095 [Streptomyces sp. NPDC058691]|uniref:EF-Tu C-terminal domain-related protein n=1 Tax=Streptomyces sp. NPDC058691 TaxID=3346601 RepID=UPI0036481C17